MGTIIEQSPVKAIIGVLTAAPSILPTVYRQLTDHFGSIDYTSELLTFTSTNYYEDEMGKDIHRQFISFENLIDAGTLAENKVSHKSDRTIIFKSRDDKKTCQFGCGVSLFSKVSPGINKRSCTPYLSQRWYLCGNHAPLLSKNLPTLGMDLSGLSFADIHQYIQPYS